MSDKIGRVFLTIKRSIEPVEDSIVVGEGSYTCLRYDYSVIAFEVMQPDANDTGTVYKSVGQLGSHWTEQD